MYDLVLTSGTSACTASTYYDAALSDRSGAPCIYIYGSTARALAPGWRPISAHPSPNLTTCVRVCFAFRGRPSLALQTLLAKEHDCPQIDENSHWQAQEPLPRTSRDGPGDGPFVLHTCAAGCTGSSLSHGMRTVAPAIAPHIHTLCPSPSRCLRLIMHNHRCYICFQCSFAH